MLKKRRQPGLNGIVCRVCRPYVLCAVQLIENNGTPTQFLDASNRFYTLIPHDFGMKKPPLLDTADAIRVCADVFLVMIIIIIIVIIISRQCLWCCHHGRAIARVHPVHSMSPTLNCQPYEGRLPLTSWWRKSSNVTVGQSKPDILSLPLLRLTSRKPLWLDLQPVDIKSRWRHNWKSAQVVNSHLVCDPTIRQPGFDLPRQQWSLLNRFRTEQGHCGACRRKWRLTDTDLCPCGETQTMSHIVESCPLTKLNGGLPRLHSADEDAVSWLTNYGK